MKQTHHGYSPRECPKTPALALSGSMPRQCCSQLGRRMNGPIPFMSDASTAEADQAAMGGPRARPGAAQVSATDCRQCGQEVLPQREHGRHHWRQDVRGGRSTAQPEAGCGAGLARTHCASMGIITQLYYKVANWMMKPALPRDISLWNPCIDAPICRQAPKRLRPRFLHGRDQGSSHATSGNHEVVHC